MEREEYLAKKEAELEVKIAQIKSDNIMSEATKQRRIKIATGLYRAAPQPEYDNLCVPICALYITRNSLICLIKGYVRN